MCLKNKWRPTLALFLGTGAAMVGLVASQAFFFATRGSPLLIARSDAVRLRRRFNDSADRDISVFFLVDWV